MNDGKVLVHSIFYFSERKFWQNLKKKYKTVNQCDL